MNFEFGGIGKGFEIYLNFFIYLQPITTRRKKNYVNWMELFIMILRNENLVNYFQQDYHQTLVFPSAL